ncbi:MULTISPECIES: phycocyanin [Cyanophyceae]|uniref:phycocyanin n=1 Tax=Cyanophyceae TaxID=3028117 RepID=UPI0007458763|nr:MULTISPECIES: phycocyanin [Cyanophyceae]AMA10219.1 phycocyanin [Picosynechococcus sp. PCC 73109]
MITLLETLLERSDGAYIEPQDLDQVDQTLQSWGDRRITYQLIQEKEEKIVDETLRRFQTENEVLLRSAPETVLKKCKGDLISVLRNCATAMLLQDEELLKDRFLYWMQNIMRALKNQKYNNEVYRIIQEVIQEELPTPYAQLMLPYLQVTHQYLSE